MSDNLPCFDAATRELEVRLPSAITVPAGALRREDDRQRGSGCKPESANVTGPVCGMGTDPFWKDPAHYRHEGKHGA